MTGDNELPAGNPSPGSQSIPQNPVEKMAFKRARRLATMPAAYRKLFERCWAGKVSPRAAIKCQCLECIGFERAAITGCTAYACPLWRLRPYQNKEGQP